MNNILRYPETCLIDKLVPKTAFYRRLEISAKMKQHFVDDVLSITWLYKLAPTTLNVTSTEGMEEIEMFVAEVKSRECPMDMFTFIDKYMPHHLVFLLHFGNEYRVLLNYKKWADAAHTRFEITENFITPWLKAENLKLEIVGNTITKIYDNFVRQVGESRLQGKDIPLAEAVLLMQKKEALQKRIELLKKDEVHECQPKKKFELHQTILKLTNELKEM